MRNKISALVVRLLTKNLYSRLTLITTVTLIFGYFVVYAWTTLELTDVEPNDTITSALMQGIVSNINDLNTRISNFSFSSGNIGIGTASPDVKIDVNGVIGIRDGGTKTYNGGIVSEIGGTLINMGVNEGQYNRFGGNYTSAKQGGMLRVSADNTYGALFQFYGRQAGVSGDSSLLASILSNGNATLAGTLTQASDVRLKKEIIPVKNPLEKISKLNGVTYYWKDPTKDNKRQIGVIAQDVEKVFPEAVATDEKGMKSVAYGNLVAPLIEAVKEQQKEIEELKGKIERLENR